MELDTLESMRDYAIFNLMARTGLRAIEVSRALVEDIRMESGQEVLWVQGREEMLKMILLFSLQRLWSLSRTT